MLCLTQTTDPGWVRVALSDLDALLVDHAHCEMKAASNAISLATRWPVSTRIAKALVAIAEEELVHFRAVLDLLESRGIALGKPEVDAYAAKLRRVPPREGGVSREDGLVDRLLVASLIEARSCERFRLLADALASGPDAELAAFYDGLFASEARHYRTFVDLAIEVSGDEGAVRARLATIAAEEGALASHLGKQALIHG